MTEIGAIRTLLASKPRPVGWAERRARIDEVGSVWPVAGDVELTAVDLGGALAEWSIVPGSDASRVLLYFHGGGYCSGSIVSHRRLVDRGGAGGGVTDARRRVIGSLPKSLSRGLRRRPDRMALSCSRQGFAAGAIAVGGDSAGGGLTVALINSLRDEPARSSPAARGWSRPGPI